MIIKACPKCHRAPAGCSRAVGIPPDDAEVWCCGVRVRGVGAWNNYVRDKGQAERYRRWHRLCRKSGCVSFNEVHP